MMKIVKCPKCGKFIHKADECFHCGNRVGFIEIAESKIHENVAEEYARMNVLIENKKYSEAIELSYVVLEWMPNLAGIFWLRLLAKNKCSTTLELICKGFPCDEDPDFCNALDFSVKEEHSAYEDVREILFKIRKSIKEEVFTHEYNCKVDTGIIQIRENMRTEIEDRKTKLFSLWSELEEIEHLLYSLDLNCRLLMTEQQFGLERAAEVASNIKFETNQLEECSVTAEKLHTLRMKIGSVLQLSESSKSELEKMRKQHPWVKSYSEMVAQREQKVQLINKEITSLANYELSIQQTLIEIESIESIHKFALEAANKFDFVCVMSLIDFDVVDKIFHDAGVIGFYW